MVDIAGAVVGGGSQLCELAMSQDASSPAVWPNPPRIEVGKSLLQRCNEF